MAVGVPIRVRVRRCAFLALALPLLMFLLLGIFVGLCCARCPAAPGRTFRSFRPPPYWLREGRRCAARRCVSFVKECWSITRYIGKACNARARPLQNRPPQAPTLGAASTRQGMSRASARGVRCRRPTPQKRDEEEIVTNATPACRGAARRRSIPFRRIKWRWCAAFRLPNVRTPGRAVARASRISRAVPDRRPFPPPLFRYRLRPCASCARDSHVHSNAPVARISIVRLWGQSSIPP